MSLHLPFADPSLRGSIKQQPEDFFVEEQLGFELSGQGEHLYLYIEKIQLTTHELIQQLAKAASLHPRHIGYSGLKDKHAITRQWISLHMPGVKNHPQIENGERFKVLQAQWHDKKLRTGVHRSNRFTVVVKNLTGQSDRLEQIVEAIRVQGFANYFGEQRFGANNENVEQALRILTHRHKAKRLSRQRKSLYISALRSELFNAILSKRIELGVWERPLPGDLFMLNGTHSLFEADIDPSIYSRYRDMDIHSAVSLYGEGISRINDQAAVLEEEIFHQHGEMTAVLDQTGVKYAYRAHRAVAVDLQVKLDEKANAMLIQVALEKGVFLTSLISHFVDFSEH